MPKSSFFREERHRIIIEQLKSEGRVAVSELSEMLDVSAVTIRQDLKALEESNLLQRTHGGAVLQVQQVQHSFSPELSFETRLQEAITQKNTLAQYAAGLVKNSHSIALDASTTVFAMLPYLKKLSRLTVVTNSVAIAYNLLDSPQIDVYLCGGKLRRDSISLVREPQTLPALNLHLGFYSAHGITAETGVTESNKAEVEIKRMMMQRSAENYVLVDARKWGKIAPYPFAQFNEIDAILTPDTAPSDVLHTIQDGGTTILTVPLV